MDVDVDNKVVQISNLSRNVVESHLSTIFGFYGTIAKIDLPVYVKCEFHSAHPWPQLNSFNAAGQNRGRAALEYAQASEAQLAISHMNGGQLDGAILKVELSDVPLRSRSHSRSPSRTRHSKNSRTRRSLSLSRSRSPLYRKRGSRRESYRGRPPFKGRRGTGRDYPRARSRTRSRSPVRRADRLGPRRRSPSYSRGGYARGRRSKSRSYSVRSSRSRTRSRSISRSRSRSRSSYSSYSRYSRSRTRSRSFSRSRGRRSYSRDDIRDSRSRSRD